MLSLFSIKHPSSSANEQANQASNHEAKPVDNAEAAFLKDPQGRTINEHQTDVKSGLQRDESIWATKRGRSRKFFGHGDGCECCLRPLPMQQSVDEMEWERGIWGLASSGKYER